MIIPSFKQFYSEAIISPSTEPNTLTLFHGGNLEDAYDESLAHKKGRYEFGPGLYLTTHYSTAKKYAKGSRKFYQIVISKGTELDTSFLDYDKCMEFINSYIIRRKRNEIVYSIDTRNQNGKVPAYIFLNSIVNNQAIQSTNTGKLRMFLVQNEIDYNEVDNAFGWHEKMIVLYNMKKIVSKTIIKPNDEITYDLPTKWN